MTEGSSMKLNVRQGIVQQQKQILTLHMRQSLKTLEMPITDLLNDISKRLEENPLLEAQVSETYTRDELAYAKKMEKEGYSYSDTIQYNPDKNIDPLNFVIEDKTLKEYLNEQLIDIVESRKTKNICTYIIECLDERGYLYCNILDIANDLHINIQEVEYALTLVQQLEPDGIGARNLIECLEIQLEKNGLNDKKLLQIIQNHLNMIAENKLKQLSSILEISMEDLQEYIEIIKSLEPIPSRGYFTGNDDVYIVPEATIEAIGEEIFLRMNDKALPKLSINEYYTDIIKDGVDSKTNKYVKERLKNAKQYIQSVEQRNDTLYLILEHIVEKQEQYFLKGLQYLKPMTIGEIAKKLDLNESTISRAIKDKYILTPYGMVKIKKLFTSALKSNTSSDNSISANVVMMKINELIENEEKKKPLSDDAIAKKLGENGIKIARRTVSKYRESLEIPSSSKRKEY